MHDRSRRLLSAALFLICIILPPFAHAGGGVYAGGKTGVSVNKADGASAGSGRHASSTYGLLLGYGFAPETGLPLRLELEGSFRGGDQTLSYNSSLGNRLEINFSLGLMLQGWLELPVSEKIRSYAGGGAGVVMAHYKARRAGRREERNDAWSRAWMLGGGINWKALESIWLDLGYRYTEANHFAAEFKALPDYDFKIRSHDVQLGIRVEF